MTPTASYVISNLLWSIAGLALGYVAVLALVFAAGFVLGFHTGRATVPRADSFPTGDQLMPRLRFDRIIGVVVIVLSLVSITAAAITIHRQSEQVACQTRFNQAFAASLEQRAEAATKEREAQRVLLTGTYTTPEEGAAARLQYLRALDDADDQRAASPLPPQPVC